MSTEAPPPAPPILDPPIVLDARRKRILFRATHRGTHENDLLIGGFLSSRVAAMSEDDLVAVEAMLTLPDPDLADWLSGRRSLPPDHDTPLLRAMCAASLGKPTGPA